ncbi:MAG: nucleotide disphospho-sugar-binding domain-containing protein [Devosia sp.]
MAACVHHGGAGTTGASLRAGKPTVRCPFFRRPAFWAKRVQDLGLGPASIDRKNLTVASLASAIRTATSSRLMDEAAAEFGAQIRAEDGVGAAIAFLHRQGLLPS